MNEVVVLDDCTRDVDAVAIDYFCCLFVCLLAVEMVLMGNWS